ncbi:MAG: hypothetical protein K0S36_2405 [Nitrosospira multiformis]|jgi:hypothetical protein|nr:hypothetical protein [Nitrosospira multiformis]
MGKNEITITFLARWVYTAETSRQLIAKQWFHLMLSDHVADFREQEVNLGMKFALFAL